jgi:WD40 repeat protein
MNKYFLSVSLLVLMLSSAVHHLLQSLPLSAMSRLNSNGQEDCSNVRIWTTNISPDGKYIFATWKSQVGRLWDFKNYAFLYDVEDTYDVAVLSSSFSADGKYIATGGSNDTALIRDVASGTLLKTFHVTEEKSPDSGFWIEHIEFSPNGKYLLTATLTGAQIWDIESGKQIQNFLNDNEDREAQFSPDSRQVIVAGHTAKLWDIESGKLIHTFNDFHAKFSANGKYILSYTN